MKSNTNREQIIRSADGMKNGFTLVEILVVVVILGILASIVAAKVSGHTEKAKKAKTEADIQTIKLAVGQYEMDNGNNPSALSDLVSGEKHYIDQESVPMDAWGNDFRYYMKGDLVKIQSAGPDGNFDTDDDIINK